MTEADTVPARGTLAGREGRGIALVLLAVLCFGVLDATSKTLAQDYPVMQVVWARYFFHLVIFTPVTWWHHRGAVFATRRPGLHVVRALLLVSVTVLFVVALSYMPLADAPALSFVSPLIVTLRSVLFLKEKVGLTRWAAVGLGFLGVLVIIRPGAGVMHWASFLVLGMAVCFAGYQLTTRALNRTELPVTTLFYTALVGTVAGSLPLPFVWVWPSAEDWVLMLLLGFLGGFGHFILIIALRHASPAIVAPFMYVQLIYATVLGALLFGQVPDLWTAAGAGLITAGGLWSLWCERQRMRAAADASAQPR